MFSRVTTSAWLTAAFVAAYLVLFEVYSGATFHESDKLTSIARALLTFLPYLAPVLFIEALARGRVRKALLGTYLAVHAIVDMAFITSRGVLDFAFLRDNFAEA